MVIKQFAGDVSSPCWPEGVVILTSVQADAEFACLLACRLTSGYQALCSRRSSVGAYSLAPAAREAQSQCGAPGASAVGMAAQQSQECTAPLSAQGVRAQEGSLMSHFGELVASSHASCTQEICH